MGYGWTSAGDIAYWEKLADFNERQRMNMNFRAKYFF